MFEGKDVYELGCFRVRVFWGKEVLGCPRNRVF